MKDCHRNLSAKANSVWISNYKHVFCNSVTVLATLSVLLEFSFVFTVFYFCAFKACKLVLSEANNAQFVYNRLYRRCGKFGFC